MRPLLQQLERLALVVTERMAGIGVLGILGIGFVTVADVFMRAVFNDPIDGLNEITRPLLAIGVAACLLAWRAASASPSTSRSRRWAGRPSPG